MRVRVVTHIRSTMRTRVLASSSAAMLLALAGCTSSRDDPRTEFTTELGIEGETSITRALQPGAYLVELRERDVDVHLAIDAPGIRSEVSDEVPRHGVLHELVTLQTPAQLRVTGSHELGWHLVQAEIIRREMVAHISDVTQFHQEIRREFLLQIEVELI